MADVHDTETRSRNMAAIQGKNTRPELMLRKALFARGFRYRLHDKRIPGRPDLVLKKYNSVVFVHGCFWHAHSCPLFKWPRTREDFWRQKIGRNSERDAEVRHTLRADGWRVAVIWECALKGKGRLPLTAVTDQVSRWVIGSERELVIEGQWIA